MKKVIITIILALLAFGFSDAQISTNSKGELSFQTQTKSSKFSKISTLKSNYINTITSEITKIFGKPTSSRVVTWVKKGVENSYSIKITGNIIQIKATYSSDNSKIKTQINQLNAIIKKYKYTKK